MPQAGGSLDPRWVLGRDALVEAMYERLARGVPLLITDPRRMGKTSLLDRFVFLARAPWTAVKVDYEGVTSVDEFLRRTLEALRDQQAIHHRVVEVAKVFVPDIAVSTGPVKVATTFKARPRADIFETVISRLDDGLQGERSLVIAMDEVPIAVENIAKSEGPLAADALLQSLRRLRQRRGSHIGWIVTGSVGFHHVLRLAQSTEGAINDLENMPCGPLTVEWASVLARRLFEGIRADVDDDTVALLVEVSGAIPHVMHSLVVTLQGREDTCDPSAVRRAWEAFVLDRDQSRAFTHLLTRIGDYYGEHERLAFRLLDALARADEPLSWPALVDAVHPQSATEAEAEPIHTIVDFLVDDHYLCQVTGGFEWRYPVLREIWAVRRRLGLR